MHAREQLGCRFEGAEATRTTECFRPAFEETRVQQCDEDAVNTHPHAMRIARLRFTIVNISIRLNDAKSERLSGSFAEHVITVFTVVVVLLLISGKNRIY